MKLQHGLWAGALLALTGCATPVPTTPPALPAFGAAFAGARAAEPGALDAATWRGFDDPALEALVARARTANHDVRIAAERLRQARAGATAQASRLLPTLALTGSASDQRSGLPADVKRGSPDTRALRGALDLGWEVDIAGAARAAADAAALDALAAGAGVEGAQLIATTEVARHYLIWQGARVRLQQLEALLATQRDTARLTRSRLDAGQASRFDLARAEGEVAQLAAQLPPLRTLVDVSAHQIAVLLGEAPGALRLDAAAGLPAVPVLTPGQPAELLQRRPDLRAAEATLRAESARRRESEADLWPKFFLAAVLGRQDLRLNGLDLAPVRYSNLALAFTAPLFNAGRLQAAVERQSARERVATLQYERAVLSALQDAENSLAQLRDERARGDALLAALQSRRDALRHAQSLHREGQIDLLTLLDAQRGLIAAELAVSDHQTQLALSTVQLVRALGGGWVTQKA